MKLVINKCYGGFGLSPLAVKRICERKGRPWYFFTQDIKNGLRSEYLPATLEEATKAFMFFAFDVPNPNVALPSNDKWHEMSLEERKASNEAYEHHSVEHGHWTDRTDPDLVATVEELGDAANGSHAKLAVVEIPDGTEYEIGEYDGIETVHEVHRSWG